MEEIFIKALAERSKKDTSLLDKLPEDIQNMVRTLLSLQVQEPEQES